MKVMQQNIDYGKLAALLGFLREARSVTLQSLAAAHGAHRSNLSAFVNSSGKVRNISFDKIRRILFDLGVFFDGGMRPGLHRWEISNQKDIPEMCRLLTENQFVSGILFDLGSGYGSYLVAKVSDSVVVFASLPPDFGDVVKEEMGSMADRIGSTTLNRAGDAQILNLWETKKDDPAVMKSLLALID